MKIYVKNRNKHITATAIKSKPFREWKKHSKIYSSPYYFSRECYSIVITIQFKPSYRLSYIQRPTHRLNTNNLQSEYKPAENIASKIGYKLSLTSVYCVYSWVYWICENIFIPLPLSRSFDMYCTACTHLDNIRKLTETLFNMPFNGINAWDSVYFVHSSPWTMNTKMKKLKFIWKRNIKKINKSHIWLCDMHWARGQ